MSLRFKLTYIILAMIFTVMLILSVFTLTRSSRLQTETAFSYAMELARAESIEVQRRVQVFSDYVHVIAQLLGEYEGTEEELRRGSFEDILRSIIQRNEQIVGIWTAWHPGAIDGRDAELGQFQLFYTRRYGGLDLLPAGYEGWQGYLANMRRAPSIAPPVWREIAGFGEVPVVAVMFPIINERADRVVGVVGINYISHMQDIVDDIRGRVYDGKGVAGVFSEDGAIVAYWNHERVRENIRTSANQKALLGDQHDRVMRAVLGGGENGKPITLTRFCPELGTDMLLVYFPIHISEMESYWMLMLGIPMNAINRPIRQTMIITLIFTVIILAIAAAITFVVAGRITKPIVAVANTLRDISEGEGDLTKRIESHSADEIGALSRYFNLTLEKIRSLIVAIKKEAATLDSIGHDLANNMSETAGSVNQITESIRAIKGRVISQSASVTQTHATMEQVVGNINKLNSHVDSQSSHVAQASAAVEEMVANINSVTRTLVNNAENVQILKGASEVGRLGLSEVAGDIQEISKESEGLLEINALMKNIASQTNLLSMNAAIEAAHAGEAGKGFAVVADEIRKLAESSGEQSKTIGDVLQKIKGSIDKINRSTANVLDKFEAIDIAVKIVVDQEDTIRRAMEEQEIGSNQLLAGIGSVNTITREVTSGSHEMLGGSTEVIQESEKLEVATQEIAQGVNEMASGADEINAAVHHVHDLSGKNQTGIQNLMKEVSRFKV